MFRYSFPSIFIEDYTLSEIEEKDGKWYPPENVRDDTSFEQDFYSSLEEVNNLRMRSFDECNLGDYELPFVPFLFSETLKTERDLKRFMRPFIKDFPFIKLCSMSPKDCRDGNCVFDNVDEAISVITKQSERTSDWKGKHLVMKRFRKFTHEWRCLYIHDTLRAVISVKEISEDEKNLITNFFEKYKYNLPHTCCIELGFSEYGVEVIEMNPLGPDLRCDISPFSWRDDWYLLYTTKTPIYRYLYDNIKLN